MLNLTKKEALKYFLEKDIIKKYNGLYEIYVWETVSGNKVIKEKIDYYLDTANGFSIKDIELLNKKYPQYIDIELSVSYSYDACGIGDADIYFYGWRIESDAEKKDRIDKKKLKSKKAKEAAKKRKATMEKKERELYEKLRKKYDNSVQKVQK